MKAKLSERVVKAAEIGSRKYVLFDEDTPGFGLCVYTTGRKGFVLIYRIAGQQKRFTIGVWPTWSVTAARDEAKRLIREIDRGEDPLDTRKADRLFDNRSPALGPRPLPPLGAGRDNHAARAGRLCCTGR